MELRRHIEVLWRFRLIVVGGILVGMVLAVLAAFNVGWSGGPTLNWRTPQTWTSKSTLFVTQVGFPWGRVTLPSTVPGVTPQGTVPGEDGTAQERREYGAPERFSDLAVVYSYLARSQEVRALIEPRPAADQIVITPILNPATGAGLPLLEVDANAFDPVIAQRLNAAAVDALRGYLESEQRSAGIASSLRVKIQVLNAPTPAAVTEGRSFMASIVAMILALAAAVGFAYLLENLRISAARRHAPRGGDPAGDRPDGLEEAWADQPAAKPLRSRSRTAA